MTMPRLEFSRKTRREALKRSGKHCEATGPRYGLDPGVRCFAPLAFGVEFDHVIEAALGGDNSLDNCAAVCGPCHRFKTGKGKGEIERAKRRQDKASGVIKPRGFPARTRINSDTGERERWTGFRWKEMG